MIHLLQPEDKLLDSGVMECDMLYVQGIFNQFTPSVNFFKIITKTENSMIIKAFKPEETIKYLIEIPEVESICKYTPPKLSNNLAPGFTQKNTENITKDMNGNPTIPRYLTSKGITGKNQVVATIDTSIDYHTMFYDPKVEFKFNQTMSNHRKILFYYNSYKSESELYQNIQMREHGTSTSSVFTGSAYNSNSSISSYNGMAPDAKLMYLGSLFDSSNPYYQEMNKQTEILQTNNVRVFSNSWSSSNSTFSLEQDYNYDHSLFYNDVNCLYVFSAGNDGDTNKEYSIGSPSSAKNILSVGSIERIYDYQNYHIFISDGTSNVEIYITSLELPDLLIAFSEARYLSDIDDFSLPKGTLKILYLNEEIFQKYSIEYIILKINEQAENYEISVFYVLDISSERYEMINKYFNGVNLITYYSNSLKKMVGKYIQIHIKYDLMVKKPISSLKRISYSSVGPSRKGILKPDVVGPGSCIITANSKTYIDKDHGSNNNNYEDDLIIVDGTSFATPNVAGVATLISQYLEDKYYLNEKINVNSLLLKSLIIASASKLDGSLKPDCYYGHGLVDISTVLPFNESNFGLRFSNLMHFVKGNLHHIGKININNKNVSLRIVMCSHDPPLNTVSAIPIYFDLDLIVVSPTKKIYIGNGRTQDTEHLSLNEKVIIPINELEIGEYEIHVISNVEILEGYSIPYVVTVVGPFTQDDVELNPMYIEMKNTIECIPSKNGICENGKLKCNSNYVGQLCNIQYKTISDYTTNSIDIEPNEFIYYKIPIQRQFSKLILASISNDHYNMFSELYIMKTKDDYLPLHASTIFNVPNPYYIFNINDNNKFMIIDTSKDNYVMLLNNYRDKTSFKLHTLQMPGNGPICICPYNKCSNSSICNSQNIYSNENALFGLIHYLDRRTIYVDQSITIDCGMLLGNYRYDIQLLNTNGRRHTVKFTGWSELASLGVDLNQVWANLVASNLNIEFAGTYSVTQTNEANNDENTIHFEYLNLTNVTLITNDYILDANQLFIDFESYTSSLMQDNVNITDANTPIASIIFYDDYIELVSSDEVIKRIYLSENMSFTFETNRPTSSTLKIVDGEGGNIHLPYGVTITIISYNEDGFDFLIDDSLKELIYVLAKPLNKLLKKYLTPIEIAAIVIGCVAGVGLTIILLCIRWHKLKNIAREKIVEMSMPELDGLQQEEKITGVKKNDKEVYVNFE